MDSKSGGLVQGIAGKSGSQGAKCSGLLVTLDDAIITLFGPDMKAKVLDEATNDTKCSPCPHYYL